MAPVVTIASTVFDERKRFSRPESDGSKWSKSVVETVGIIAAVFQKIQELR
jgi:hypothetical protein